MNKILRFSLIAFMAMLGLNMSAQTVVTFDASEDKGTRGSDNPGEDQITKDGITIAVGMNRTDTVGISIMGNGCQFIGCCLINFGIGDDASDCCIGIRIGIAGHF